MGLVFSSLWIEMRRASFGWLVCLLVGWLVCLFACLFIGWVDKDLEMIKEEELGTYTTRGKQF